MRFQTPEFIHVEGYEVYPANMGRSNAIPLAIKQRARFYIKGLKQLWQASFEKRSFEKMGEQVHGNTNTQHSKYMKLVKATNYSDTIRIGQGASFTIQSYVDGSYSVAVSF